MKKCHTSVSQLIIFRKPFREIKLNRYKGEEQGGEEEEEVLKLQSHREVSLFKEQSAHGVFDRRKKNKNETTRTRTNIINF